MKKVIVLILILSCAFFYQMQIFSDSDSGFRTENNPEEKSRREISAIMQIYGKYINRTIKMADDTIFIINGSRIYYKNGKMLARENLSKEKNYASVFYEYKKGEMAKIPTLNEDILKQSRDFWDNIFGTEEMQIRKHCQLISFLDHKTFVNNICVEALRNIEKEIMNAARTGKEVQRYLDELYIFYSFQQKQVIGSKNQSFHSYGLALDLVPKSYKGKHVYWKWSRVLDRQNWFRIPLKRRWHPPQEVIDAFENNGFVWGGKWYHFDTIHFEYRPEIIMLSK